MVGRLTVWERQIPPCQPAEAWPGHMAGSDTGESGRAGDDGAESDDDQRNRTVEMTFEGRNLGLGHDIAPFLG